jgi:hypothetical protein
MEAVRELLFGKRVAEFHVQMENLEQRMNAAVHRLETYAQQRFAEIERLVQETERRIAMTISGEVSDRQADSVLSKKMVDERFSLVHRNMETFALETAKHLEAGRHELHTVHQELSAETKHLRDHTPTLHVLADLFHSTSQQLRAVLPNAPGQPAEAPCDRASEPSPESVFEGLPS